MEKEYDKSGEYPKTDYVGYSFRQLTILRWEGRNRWYENMWLCQCSCGNKKIIGQSNLKRRAAVSCGCFQKVSRLKHGHSPCDRRHPLYNKFYNMKQRCYDKNFIWYKNYGGRGIKICDEWVNSPEIFIEWGMANGYREGLTIERINNDGDYSPENCCFITLSEQSNNKRSTRWITYEDKTQTIGQWAGDMGLEYATLRYRINQEWPIEEALFTPLHAKRKSKQT